MMKLNRLVASEEEFIGYVIVTGICGNIKG